MKKYGLPQPRHEHGYCQAEINSFMFPGLAKEFGDWMYGQTCMMEDGSLIYYFQDVISFVEGILSKARGVPVYD